VYGNSEVLHFSDIERLACRTISSSLLSFMCVCVCVCWGCSVWGDSEELGAAAARYRRWTHGSRRRRLRHFQPSTTQEVRGTLTRPLPNTLYQSRVHYITHPHTHSLSVNMQLAYCSCPTSVIYV